MEDCRYLESTIKQFEYYRDLATRAMNQVEEDDIFRQPNDESNSIAIIMNHMIGNIHSRWTDFLTSDGEKEWRNRDAEFELVSTSQSELFAKWNDAWNLLITTLASLSDSQLNQIVYIRNSGHTILEAINRQLAHYSYHIGQIVFISKMYSQSWKSLTIPKNKSQEFNNLKFSDEKSQQFFTDDDIDMDSL